MNAEGKGGFFPAVHQIGYAVRDLDAALRHYQYLTGPAAPVNRFEVVLDRSNGYRYLGQEAACCLDIATIAAPHMDFEFIQVLEGDHPARDYLTRHGDGINHLGLYLSELAPLKEQILGNGGRIINEGSFEVGAGRRGVFAYMQLAPSVYPLYELLQM